MSSAGWPENCKHREQEMKQNSTSSALRVQLGLGLDFDSFRYFLTVFVKSLLVQLFRSIYFLLFLKPFRVNYIHVDDDILVIVTAHFPTLN